MFSGGGFIGTSTSGGGGGEDHGHPSTSKLNKEPFHFGPLDPAHFICHKDFYDDFPGCAYEGKRFSSKQQKEYVAFVKDLTLRALPLVPWPDHIKVALREDLETGEVLGAVARLFAARSDVDFPTFLSLLGYQMVLASLRTKLVDKMAGTLNYGKTQRLVITEIKDGLAYGKWETDISQTKVLGIKFVEAKVDIKPIVLCPGQNTKWDGLQPFFHLADAIDPKDLYDRKASDKEDRYTTGTLVKTLLVNEKLPEGVVMKFQ